MANRYDTGMDDAYQGKEIKGNDPGLEYLRGYSYAESLLHPEKHPQKQEQDDNRENPKWYEQN